MSGASGRRSSGRPTPEVAVLGMVLKNLRKIFNLLLTVKVYNGSIYIEYITYLYTTL